ncbi:hypothetical protein L596_017847 [Steinernema carpocapsae]|uniref:Uncharacterized protein n=1 Tax=Steinernema carpocapsae TaxID=34508 RepID=A0A4U5N388_STECR|nr:hypothetical protein L596_017847 [Steinernema carpocapsae]
MWAPPLSKVKERANQLIKQLEKKGPIATVSKILFGPPPKNTSVKGGKKEGKEGGKEGDKAVSSEEN